MPRDDQARHQDTEVPRELSLQFVVARSTGVHHQPVDPALKALAVWNMFQATDRNAPVTFPIRARTLSGSVVPTV